MSGRRRDGSELNRFIAAGKAYGLDVWYDASERPTARAPTGG
jgi:hypothetical protein